MKKRNVILAGILASIFAVIRTLHKSLRVELENRSGRTLDLAIGTEAVPDALHIQGLKDGEKRTIDLTDLPLLSHDAVFIRFPQEGDRPSYIRTLIYDVDEAQGHRKAAIVDYGQGYLDIRSSRP